MSADESKANGNRKSMRDHDRLRDGESLFLSLVHSIPACFIRKDRDGRIVFVNDKFAALFGKTPGDIIGKTLADFYPKDLAEEARREDEQVMNSGEVLEDVFEDFVDGQLKYYASRKGPVRGENGNVIGIQTIFWDITEQRVAENAMLAERDMLQSILNHLPDFIYVKDLNGRYIVVNEAKREILNADSVSELVGQSNEAFLSKEHAEREWADDRIVISDGAPLLNREERVTDESTGKDLWLLNSKLPLTDFQGSVTGMISIDRNITHFKDTEEKLRASKEIADEANRAKSDFLANMSHEIRTPMNAIIGMTDLLLETQLTQTQHEYLRMVQDSGEALLTLINDILDFSKIEAGKFELECTTFDIRESLGDTMKGMGFRAHGKGLELAFRVDESIPKFLKGDPGRIRQIVINLVGNAIKFTETGEVVLEIGCVQKNESQATLRFSVIDTGIGIAESQCEKVFKEFEQADASTTRKFGGTGLGLTISSRLVELMNGRIWVESELGKGSKFQFEIPLEIDHSVTALTRSDSQVNIQAVRVLIVDDNATNRRILKDMLTNWGMNPVTTSGAAPALQALADANEEEDSFRIVISDVNMPDMDGLMLAKAIAEQGLLDPASVIMLTSGARPNDSTELRSLGITQHLLKPVKQSEVYDAVVTSLNATGITATTSQVNPETSSPAGSLDELQILLAEDNVVNQKLAVGILEKLGHRVSIANNGKEALEKLEQQAFDLVLMDVQMPEMDGLAATRELRRREAHVDKHTPVVAMTAHAIKGDREHCLASGMDDYLCKPIRLKDISNKLKELFSGSNGGYPGKPAAVPSTDDDDTVPWPEALANVGGDAELLNELIEVFLSDTPGLMNKALKAAKEEDTDALRAAAHTVKGSMMFLNPKHALASAQAVERLAGEGNLAASCEALEELQGHFATVCKCLQTRLEQSKR